MGRVARGANGIVVVDKPAGITSYDVVRKLKGLLSGLKIGYLGTLDPLATGVLPLLLGEGTKLAPFLEAGHKVYEAVLHLGVVTDTQDREGRVLQSVEVGGYDLSPQKIEEVIGRFRGRIMQLPPMYSALKQNGEPLYKLARRGEEVERALREVEIYELRVTEIDPPYLHLYIECSKGTYIRTMAHDIGRELGCGAHLTALRRTRSGPFSLDDALTLDDIEGLLKTGKLKKRMIPLAQAMAFLPAVEVEEADALQISNGQVITLADASHRSEEDAPQGGRKEVPQVPSVAQQHPDNQFSIQKRAGHFNKNMVVGMPHSGRGLKEAQVVRGVAREGGGLVAVGAIQHGTKGLVLRPLRVFHDAVFTKRPPYGRDRVHTMVDQGGR
ncbi:MAG: tRNA pseudouridine(55) synthase TruB [Deltaproteobacteria bacterium RBG_16_54_11]|nr:MAG: tRNA pseudouridine(55) synthase TruB [Deltaproteobacteria bacterium RBG_16_54_11]